MRRSRGLLLGMLILAAGCAKPHPADEGRKVLDRNEFVEIFVDLRIAALESDSIAEFERKKLEILDRHKVTFLDLTAYIDRNKTDLKGLLATWDSIQNRFSRLDSLAGESR